MIRLLFVGNSFGDWEKAKVMQGHTLIPELAARLDQGRIFFLCIYVVGVAAFGYIVWRRLIPLLRAQGDPRFDHPLLRLRNVAQFWLGQWKHPRYWFAGILHIVIFAGFLVLSIRSVSLVLLGISERFDLPMSGQFWGLYRFVKDYATTFVFLAVSAAAIRRGVYCPPRYGVPAKYGKSHTAEALLVLALIGTLMLSESLFEATKSALRLRLGELQEPVAAWSLAWAWQLPLRPASISLLQMLHLGGYLVHELTFFGFLCFLPLGKHFHVLTSFFNVFSARLERTTLKPVRWGTNDEQLDQVKAFGVKTFEDFTWKHMLDFYTCADCGRCSDNCPAHAAGRPLSPRFLTTKARDYAFQHYPVFGKAECGKAGNGNALVGNIFSEDEIWSCTTCGACEAECPLLIEYIDKIVDLRRGLIDDGNVPQSLQKPLKALESRGNPYGKMEKKRADWAIAKDFPLQIRRLDKDPGANTLYFVDSVTSYDDRMHSIARATARILDYLGENFGILGPPEKDSGHDVRRFGEETLFLALRDQNTDAIHASGAQRIVTADPHAYNALKHDYKDIPPVEHISQVLAREVRSGKLKFKPIENDGRVYTYHDPCYLGRHNQVYDDPRAVLDAIPGLRRVEMKRSRDRSFCCGGGGLMLFYEPKEDERIGVKRVRMAAEAGANVIVTACPFCMTNLEDAIKVAGLEGTMTAIDLAELADQQVAREKPSVETSSAIPQEYASGR